MENAPGTNQAPIPLDSVPTFTDPGQFIGSMAPAGAMAGGKRKIEMAPNVSAPPVITPETVAAYANPYSKPAEPSVAPAKKEAKPIVLGYKYTGTCPTCFNEVDTILTKSPLGKGFSYHATAWCNTCKTQLQETKVEPL